MPNTRRDGHTAKNQRHAPVQVDGEMRSVPVRIIDSPDKAIAPYANLAFAQPTDRDLRLTFAHANPPILIPGDGQKLTHVDAFVVARVVLAQQTADEYIKLLARLLGYKLTKEGEEVADDQAEASENS